MHFEKFVRGHHDPSSHTVDTGRGLGLTISRAIVTRMGGTLDLVDGPLPGACFRLSFPLLPEAKELDAALPNPAQDGQMR